MKTRSTFVRTAVALVATAVSLIAAASDKDDFERRAERLRTGPESAPMSNETGFSKGLKCMDNLFRAYGINGVAVVLDTIPDATKKINVGARDMFLSATADMTRTSHAVRLIPIVESRVFTETKRERVIADADFAIQGSISQFDESMLSKQRDGAVCIWKLCVGAADSDKISGLGLDLNLVETQGMSLVPGASVKNAVLLRRHGDGYDGDLTVKNFSIEYNFTLVSSDANGQALRTLIELGAIELYGRMLKLPYWTCMGASDQDPAVAGEINDWWEEMAADPRNTTRLMGYLQLQMKAQGVYDGEINGRGNQALLRAVRAYALALGLPDDLNLDGRFLRKYLAADHAQVRKVAAAKLAEINQREGPLAPEPVAQAAPQSAAAGPGAPTGPATPTPAPTAQTTTTVAQTGPTTPTAAPTAQTTTAVAPGPTTPTAAPTAQTTTAVAPTAQATPTGSATPGGRPAVVRVAASAPAASASSAVPAPAAQPAVASASQPPAPAHMQRAAYHGSQPVATVAIEGSRPANNAAYRAGEPFFVGVISPRDGYLYCYLVDDQRRVSQFYPSQAQSPARLPSGTLTVVNSGSPLLASRPEHKEKVACFSSPKDLGQQPLEPGSVVGLEALKTQFAIAVSGAYAMGVFDVKVQ
jgi:Domain of unknown function (DUF4384)